MAYGSTHPAEVHHFDSAVHVVTWAASLLGVFAAAIGAWIALAPADGTISVFGRSWAASDLTSTWGPWLLIIGGGVAAVGMAASAVLDVRHGANRWLIAAELLLAVAGLGSMIAGLTILT